VARPARGQVVERRGKRGIVYALRFRAYGKRHHVTTDARSRAEAEIELANILADVRRGIWRRRVELPEPVAPQEEPIFWDLARGYVDRRSHEVDERTAEHWEWALNSHLRDYFGPRRPSGITAAVVDAYKAEKLREETLSAGSINKTLKVLAQILDDAIEYGYIETNPARGRKRRLKASRPKRTWLEIDEVRALLEAAGKHRALLATMILGGLRISELLALRWRDVDLAGARLKVQDSKTDAGERTIDLSPLLLDELKVHKATARFDQPADFVFATRNGTARNRSNVTRQILAKAIERANKTRVKAELSAIEGVTNHSLRRTYASLLYEAGASPAYVMAQMGHTSSALALEVYTKVMERKRDTGARMDALIQGADWAQMGTNGAESENPLSSPETQNPAEAGLS
jgi:integrase